MTTLEKLKTLPKETQKECRRLMNWHRKKGIVDDNTWANIVDWYYEQEDHTPVGWFQWWED